ncbi:MAG: translation initiation factor [Cyanobacteria bacterium RYN_339]|nr:translation initiation factor [Cyanobacteria bacterium RYN_339]
MGKVQVCKMAKDLNVPTKNLLEAFNELGVDVKNHLAWVEDVDAEAVKKKLLEPPAPEPAAAPKVEAKAAPPANIMSRPQLPLGAPRGGTGSLTSPHRQPGAPAGPGGGGQPNLLRRPEPGAPARELRPDMRHEIRQPAGPTDRGFPARPGGPGGDRPGGGPPGDQRPPARSDKDRRAERDAGRRVNADGEEMPATKSKARKKSRAEQRQEREERRQRRNDRNSAGPAPDKIELVGPLSVKELAEKMVAKETEIIKRLFLKGIMATINQTIEKETAEMIAVEMGYEVELIDPIQLALAAVTDDHDEPEDLKTRPPIVTIMGHVDHGKTSLLDAIRSARVAHGEAGGITQHIGAYMTSIHGNEICFLDTPGHEAFTAMRARGAKATDIAVVVVAADDGVMPQTIEAISHAKAAGVPIIVAINKIDKPGAQPERVKQELTEYGLVAEDWGGSTVMVEVSAKMKQNLEQLLEMILLVAEVQELKANPNKLARGVIVEAKLSKSMGPVATVLVQNGTLRVGDPFVVGSVAGKVRALIDDRGRRVKEAGPAHPVEVLGMDTVPHAGDVFQAVESEKVARNIADGRALVDRAENLASGNRTHLKDFYSRIQEGAKELPIIIKTDVKGSNEAIEQALSQLNERTMGSTIRILLSGNGDISENDISLAVASNAIVIGFNVKMDERVKRAADEQDVDVKQYTIIYKMIEDLEKAMQGLLEPEYEQVSIGKAEVRATFKSGKTSVIAGCMVLEGKLQRNSDVKITRDGKEIFAGKLDSLKRFKDDAKEVATGYECGLSFDKFNDLQEGDQIEAFITQEKKR